jgi:hypothetical protein
MKIEAFNATLARLFPEPRVHVRAYVRVRLGQIEHVCSHTRKWPEHQFTLTLH